MKVIDLLVKIANNEELPQYVKYRNWNNNSFEKMLVCKENLFYKLDQLAIYLNDEIEIIEEETTTEQKFTGWQIIQNGKVVASYNYNVPTLKKVDVVDVEKDIKEILEEKPKKIKEIKSTISYYFTYEDERLTEDFSGISKHLLSNIDKINELTRAVNYLLEKESDK